MKKFALLAASTALLAGCAAGLDYSGPQQLEAPEKFMSESELSKAGASAEQAPKKWWMIFNDPMLDAIEEKVRGSSLDILAAQARIEQSRAALEAAKSPLLPNFGLGADYARRGLSENGPMAALGAPTNSSNLWTASAASSWELDLWGRSSRRVEASEARLFSKAYEKELAFVSVTAEAARIYIKIREMQERLAEARIQLEAAESMLAVMKRRAAQGEADFSDEAAAGIDVETAASKVEQISSGLHALVNALNVLLALAPGSIDDDLAAASGVPLAQGVVPAGVPSDLLKRRPDIRIAEKNLHAAAASVGAARADFYPSISLNGVFGFESFEEGDLLFWGSRFFSVGPSIHIPIFQGGRLTGALKLARAQEVEAALKYKSAVLNAWREVDDSLAALAAENARLAGAEQAFKNAQLMHGKSLRRLEEGSYSAYEAAASRRTLSLRAEELAAARARRSLAVVSLYRSVGGGWDDDELAFAE